MEEGENMCRNEGGMAVKLVRMAVYGRDLWFEHDELGVMLTKAPNGKWRFVTLWLLFCSIVLIL